LVERLLCKQEVAGSSPACSTISNYWLKRAISDKLLEFLNKSSKIDAMESVWSKKHDDYAAKDWIDKPTLFAETAIEYFPQHGRILDLGAGQGQDSRYFAEQGFSVVSTDLEETALAIGRDKLPEKLKSKVDIQKLDLTKPFPFENESFDVVYAHLSLHYFDLRTTDRLLAEIHRILKTNGLLAFMVNSVHDPEYNTGEKLEEDYFATDNKYKRYFSLGTAESFTNEFEPLLVDDKGETYKDRAKGVHNLLRYIGKKA
jgi:SAM-dependent methyltransferase